MKLYDFHCNACGQEFEELVREVGDARCPSCASAEVDKQLSAFAVGGRSGGGGPSFGGGGGCGSGMCGTGGCGLS